MRTSQLLLRAEVGSFGSLGSHLRLLTHVKPVSLSMIFCFSSFQHRFMLKDDSGVCEVVAVEVGKTAA
jgi:hypothetical protein